LDNEWQKRINADYWWASGFTGSESGTPEEMALIKKLLSFGGHEACMTFREPDAARMLSRGQLWYGDNTIMMPGERSQCHRNSCCLWRVNRKTNEVAVATGYALRKDGMWRQRSWMMLRRYRSVQVVETTEPRIAYYGFVMTADEAEQFYLENC
jgi:hypothetical protein